MRAFGVRILLTLAGALLLPQHARAAEPTGVWATEDGKARVRIANCGDALCGTLISLREPNDPATGKPKTDKFNADTTKRSRPVIGIAIVLGMRPGGAPDQWTGQVYNAEDGKTYSGTLTMLGANSLRLQGCALAVFCKSQTWTRSN